MVGWCIGIAVLGAATCAEAQRYSFTQTEMAVPIEIVLYADAPDPATRAAQAAFARFRQLNAILSDYDPESELTRLSRTSGEGVAVAVSEDLWNVLQKAQELSERSDGAFDVTVGPVVRLWRRARRREVLPAQSQLAAARELVDYRQIRLLPKTRQVELLKKGMRLDLGGIAKGYAVAQAMETLRRSGIESALIVAGGDMGMSAPPPGKSGWTIGIAPLELHGKPTQHLSLAHTAVATSGDIWQYVEIEGRRYSHIVDPRTGLGLTDHSSVIVILADSAAADALATAVSVLGPQRGMKLIEATPGAACLILREPEGKLQRHQSLRWKELEETQKD